MCPSAGRTGIRRPTPHGLRARRQRRFRPYCLDSQGRRAIVPGAALAAGGLALLLDALAHGREQTVDLAAVALDHRAELLLLGQAHADALDDDVDDLELALRLEHAPVDLDGLAVAH